MVYIVRVNRKNFNDILFSIEQKSEGTNERSRAEASAFSDLFTELLLKPMIFFYLFISRGGYGMDTYTSIPSVDRIWIKKKTVSGKEKGKKIRKNTYTIV